MRFVQPRETRDMLAEHDQAMAAIQRDRERWNREKAQPRRSAPLSAPLASRPTPQPMPAVRVPTEDTLRFRFALLDRRFPSPPARPARPTVARVVCPACSTGSVAMTSLVSCPGCGALVDRRGRVVA